MKVLRLTEGTSSPLAREEELLRKLQAAGVCGPESLRLTIAGRWLFVDGFVDSLDQKFQAEKACRELAPRIMVVNRLRVAATQEAPLS